MLKEDYKKVLNDKPWQEMKEYFEDLPVEDVKLITTLNIDTQRWIDFTVDNFELAQQKSESPKKHYTEYSNRWASVNNAMGRNEHNTAELNYGINGDTNEKLKELLGEANMKMLNVDPDSILMRFIVKMPGHGIAWHMDDNGSYRMKFPDIDTSKIKRLWFPILDWRDGHAIQISKTVLTHWKAGDVYEIPWGIGHSSTNFGYEPQFTVSFTGVIDD